MKKIRKPGHIFEEKRKRKGKTDRKRRYKNNRYNTHEMYVDLDCRLARIS
ncbi:MAG: hypothetical protein WCB90_02550 [Methanosarcina sp.]